MPLKLSLKPGERVIVNGAVLQNGERRGSLILQSRARILREKDFMQRSEAITPAKQSYYAVMMLYLYGEEDDIHAKMLSDNLEKTVAFLDDDEAKDLVATISEMVMTDSHYKALSQCRKLMEKEEKRNIPSLEEFKEQRQAQSA